MHCLDVQPDLEAYVDGELSLERAAFLEQHLARCDECRAELARLQAVVDALETWPLMAEPAHLKARVMAQVQPRPALLRFRVHWSALAISLAGAGLVSAFMLLCDYLSSTHLVCLYHWQVVLRLDRLRLEGMLWTQHLVESSTVMWGLLSFVGVALIIIRSLPRWNERSDLFGGLVNIPENKSVNHSVQ